MLKTQWNTRIPPVSEIFAVYGVIVLIVYGWTIYWYLWKLPSWLYFLNVSELAVVFTYAIAINFVESLIVLAFPIGLSLSLPPKWFRDVFLSRGAALAIGLLILVILYVRIITATLNVPAQMIYLIPLGIFLLVVIIFLAGRIRILRRGLEEIAGRAVIFTYVSIPLSAVSISVVLIRNLLA